MSAKVSNAPIPRVRLISSQPPHSGNLNGKKIALVVTGVFSALSLLAAAVNAVVLGPELISFAGAAGFVAFSITFFLIRRIQNLTAAKAEDPAQQEKIKKLEKEVSDLKAAQRDLEPQLSKAHDASQKRENQASELLRETLKEYIEKAEMGAVKRKVEEEEWKKRKQAREQEQEKVLQALNKKAEEERFELEKKQIREMQALEKSFSQSK